MKKVSVFMFLIIFTLLFTQYAIGADCKEVKAGELKSMMDAGDALVVFPLSKLEYNDLHIKGSVNIPMHELKNKLPGDKENPLVFYCLGRR